MPLGDRLTAPGQAPRVAAPALKPKEEKKDKGLFGSISDFISNPVHLIQAAAGPVGFGGFGASAVKDKIPDRGIGQIPSGLAKTSAGLVPGLLNMAGNEVKATVNTIRHPSHSPIALAIRTAKGENRDGSFVNDFNRTVKETSPFAHGMGESFARTGKRFRHPTQYKKAWDEGTIVPTVVEDAGNVAIVGGLATKGLSAGANAAAEGSRLASGLQTASEVANKVTNRANWIADAPARPLRLAGQAAKEIGTSSTPLIREALAKSEYGTNLLSRAEEFSKGRKVRAQVLGEIEDRKHAIMQGYVEPRLAAAKARQIAQEMAAEQGLGKRATKQLARDLEETAIKQATGHAPVFEGLRGLPLDQQRRAANEAFGVRQRPSEGTIRMVGSDIAQQAAERILAPFRPIIEKATEEKIAGIGTDPLHPEQLGDEAMQYKIDKATAKPRAKLAQKQALADSLAERAAKARESAVAKGEVPTKRPERTAIIAEDLGKTRAERRAALAKFRDDVAFRKNKADNVWAEGRREVLGRTMDREAAAARKTGFASGNADARARMAEAAFRRASKSAGRYGDKVAAIESALAEGPAVSAPGKYVPAALAAERLNRAFGTEVPTTVEGIKAAGVKPEYLPGGVEEPYSGLSTGNKPTPGESRVSSSRQKRMGATPKSVMALGRNIAVDNTGRLRNVYEKDFLAQHETSVGEALQSKIDELRNKPNATSEELLHADDLEQVLKGNNGYDKAMALKDDGKVATSRIDPKAFTNDTRIMDRNVRKVYQQEFGSTVPKNPALRAYNKATTGIKHALLGGNPMWNVNNLASNMGVMNTVRGGMNPVDIPRYRRLAQEAMAEEIRTGVPTAPERLFNTGGAAEAMRSLSDSSEKGPLGRTLDKSYDLNNRVDNMSKRMLYMWLKDHGLSEEQAVQQTLRSMGDFTNLRPWEQSVKQVAPFYPWTRHSTRMVYDMATKHPWRSTILADLAQQQRGDPSDPSNEFDPKNPLMNGIRIGKNGVIPLGQIDPFKTGINSPVFTPSQALSSVNPIIKAGAYGLFDMNLGRNRMNTRPAQSGTRKFLSPSLKEDLYFLTQQTPQTRSLFGAFADPVARYDVGTPMTSRRKVIKSDGGRTQAVLRPFLGTYYVDAAKQAKTKKAQDAKKRAAERKRKAKT